MNTKTLLTAVTLGAGLGLASYLMHGKQEAPAAVAVDYQAAFVFDASTRYWNRVAVESEILSYDKAACRALYGEHYQAQGADCVAPVDCTSCTTHKGPARNAVIHANAWVRSKQAGPNYDAMMRQFRLVAQMSMADRAAHEAGREAYDYTMRCSRATYRSDIQCN